MVGLLPRLSVHTLTQKGRSCRSGLHLNSQIRNIQIREFNIYPLATASGSVPAYRLLRGAELVVEVAAPATPLLAIFWP